MDLEFTDDQIELGDNVRAVLDGECPPSLVRSVYEEGATADALWKHMVELWWPALAVPEDLGGLGLGFVEVSIVVEELGKHVAPSPYLATVTQFATLVAEAGDDEQRRRFLGAMAEGAITGTLAVA